MRDRPLITDAILGPTRTARVREIITDLAHRLSTRAVVETALERMSFQTHLPHVNRWRPESLALGGSGLRIALAAVHDALGVDTPLSAKSLWPGHHDTRQHDDISLFSGTTAYAASLRLTGRASAPHQGAAATLVHLVTRMEAECRRFNYETARGAMSRLDLISGMCGWAAYLLLVPGMRYQLGALRAILTTLTDVFAPPSDITRLLVPPEDLPPSQRSLAPYGYVSCGMAHGVAGLLSTLSIAELLGVSPDPRRAREAITHAGNWLVRQTAWSPRPQWPRVVMPAVSGWEPGSFDSPGWCYGTPGIARALWLAGAATDVAEYQELAKLAVLAALKLDDWRHATPTLCHGVAGILLVALHFTWDTGERHFAAGVADLVDHIIDLYDDTTLLGYRDTESDGSVVDNVGFLGGAAGMAAVLAATLRTTAPPWTRLLLLG